MEINDGFALYCQDAAGPCARNDKDCAAQYSAYVKWIVQIFQSRRELDELPFLGSQEIDRRSELGILQNVSVLLSVVKICRSVFVPSRATVCQLSTAIIFPR